MATIKDVTLSVNPGSDLSKRSVTVKATLGFDHAEIKKTFHYVISLNASDRPGDVESPFLLKNQELHVFEFGKPPNRSVIGTIKAASPTQSFSETAEVAAKLLNEDSGGSPPNPDEVIARVSLVAQHKDSDIAHLII